MSETTTQEGYYEDMTAFISCVMMDMHIVDSMRIRPEMIHHRVGEVILKIILSQISRGIKPDYMTVADELRKTGTQEDTAKWFFELDVLGYGIASPVNWEIYERRMIDYWGKKKLDDAMRSTLAMEGPSVTAEDKISALEAVMNEVELVTTGSEIVTIRETLHPLVELIEKRHKLNGKLPGVRTSIESLDSHTLGFQEQQLWIIGARPSEGKSALMGQMHRFCALKDGTRVGVISMESSRNEIGIRTISAEARIDATKINTGRMSIADFAGMNDAMAPLFELNDKIVYYDKPGLTIHDVRGIVRRMVKKHKTRVIFVDYLQLIRVSKCKTRFEEVGIASTELKRLARELNITIVALAQLGRDTQDRRPTLSDFQYSSQIEQDADVALMLWHKKQKEEKNDKEGKPYFVYNERSYIIVGKARDAITGDIPVLFRREIMTFAARDESYE